MDCWYVAATHSSREPIAAANLERQGFRVMWLRFLAQRVVRGRAIIEERGLFPSYLFVSLDLTVDRWASINSTRGVRRLLAEIGRAHV